MSWPTRPSTTVTGAANCSEDDKRWKYGIPPRRKRQLRLGTALHSPPRPHRTGGLRLGEWLHVLQPVRRGGNPQEHHRGGPRGLHGRHARSALLFDADPRLPLVHRPRQEERPFSGPQRPDPVHRRPQARHADRPRPSRSDRRDIARIADTYHAWRGDPRCRRWAANYRDIPGFCKAPPWTRSTVTATSSRRAGTSARPRSRTTANLSQKKMARLTAELRRQMEESAKLDKLIWANLKDIGYGR